MAPFNAKIKKVGLPLKTLNTPKYKHFLSFIYSASTVHGIYWLFNVALSKGGQTLTSSIPSLLTAWDPFQPEAFASEHLTTHPAPRLTQPPGQESQSPLPEGLPLEPSRPC